MWIGFKVVVNPLGGFLEYTSSKAYASFGVETNTYARDQAIRKGLTVVSSWEQLDLGAVSFQM